MSDTGVNEINIAVTATNVDAKTVFDQTAAAGVELGKKPVTIPVVASDPITDAWRAKVNAEIKGAAKEALVIPVEADTAEFRAQVEADLAGLKSIAREQIPLEAVDADQFRASVLAAVQETRAEVQAAIAQPITQTVDVTQVTDLSAGNETSAPAVFRELPPVLIPAQLALDQAVAERDAFRAQTAAEPVVVPVVAANPITDAWRSQVSASIRSISSDAVKIPVGADTAAFREQVLAQIAELSDIRENVPLEVANGPEFQAAVMEQAQALSEQVKVVIDVDPDSASLARLRANILAAAEATQEEVKAQQDLATAMEAANASGDAKSQEALAQAEMDAAAAADAGAKAATELAQAQDIAAVAAADAGKAADVAGFSMHGLSSAMMPLFGVMMIAQLAMYAFGSSSSSTATQVQDASQQIIGLGDAAGTSATSLLGGNQNLQKTSTELAAIGSSANQFAQAYSGNLAAATTYTKSLTDEQAKLGSSMLNVNQIGNSAAVALGMTGKAGAATSMSIKDLTDAANSNNDIYKELSPSAQQAVDKYNALHDIVPQATDALQGMQAEAAANAQTLANLGYVMGGLQTTENNFGLGVQSAAKALQDATSGSKYLEDATDKATIAAGQGEQQWTQLQQAVTTAGQAYDQAKQSVDNAEHSVTTSAESVSSAMHSEQQAVIATGAARTAYTNSIYQEGLAEQAVTTARQAALQSMINLQLQANDSSTSSLSANANLFDTSNSASVLGVNQGNAQQIAGEQINAGNESQVKAAISLIQAENQVADSQNSSSQAQTALNTARQEGVDNNPQVLSAQHALTQAQDGVTTAAQGVSNAEYAQQQAQQAVTNAAWSEQQAEDAVTQAKNAQAQAAAALTTATDNASRSTDANTLAGAENRQMLEGIYIAYENATGNAQVAAQMTENVGTKMGFTNTQIGNVVNSLNGLNGTNVNFAITGTPSLNAQALVAIGNQLGLNFSQIEATLPTQASGRAKAVGGPDSGLVWTGEDGPELVQLPSGSQVLPHANSMMRAAAGDVRPPGKASGGPVGALGMDLPITAQWGALDVVGQTLHALGGPPVQLPQPGTVDWGAFGGMPGSVPASSSVVSGNRAANKAIMQQVFAGFGWGSGAEWAAQDYVEMREAGYNNMAQNPTSSAFGEGQFLDSTWPAYGFTKTADPMAQAYDMAVYERARYHDPIGAAAHEKADNWYANGGPTTTGLSGINEAGAEVVRLPNGSMVMPHANSATTTAPSQVQMSIDFAPGADSAVASMFKGLARTGQIRFTAVVNGVRIPVEVG